MANKKYKIGYTQGVFDMFHIGHLNLINNAKELCDYLIVGVNSDELVNNYKNKIPVINEHDRTYIVSNIKSVDKARTVHTLDKMEMLKLFNFDAIFIGSDWANNLRWLDTKEQLSYENVDVVFLDYTDGITSTALKSLKGTEVKD